MEELEDCGVQMAQKVNVSFVDDLDGSEAEGTVVFGVDGKQYEIDLSESNAAKLRELFTPFVGAGRKVGGGARVPRMSSVSRASREDAKAIREWAAAQGLTVSARGRISAEVLEAYKARDEVPVVAPVAEAAATKKTRTRAKAKQSQLERGHR